MNRDFVRRIATALAVAACLAVGGCGRSSKDYAPSGASAKETLNRALTSWQKGEKPDRLESAAPPVNVSVSEWRNGKVLEKFEIVEEEAVPGEANKLFTTNLRLKGAKADTKARFVVVGRNPIWVYGENDFKNLLNMDNNAKPATKTR